jgi:hypothetical protein
MFTTTHKRLFQSIGFVFIMAVASSCQPQINPNSPLQQAINRFSESTPGPFFDSYYLSPSGNWLSIIEDGKLRVEATFISGDAKLFNLDDVGEYPYIVSWSQDNTTILVSGSEVRGRCIEDRIGILKVVDANKSPAVFILPNNDEGCLEATWSPDSSNVAIYRGGNRIYILDTTGRLVREIEFNDYGPVGAFWVTKGLIVDVNTTGMLNEIRMYPNPLDAKNYEVLLRDSEYGSIVGINSESGDVLLFNRDGNLRTLDSVTQEITVVAQLKGSVYYLSKESIPSRWIGFIVSPPSSSKIKDHHLYIFDWETNQVKDYGKAVFLFGWSSDMNGFIVAKDDPKGYQVDIVKP